MPHSVAFADKWTATITLAGVFAFLTTSANESWVELVVVAQSSLSQLVLASVLVDDWHVNFLQDVLVLSVLPVVLAPSGGPASLTGEVGELVGQTGGADVWCSREVHWLAQLEDRQIVVEGSGVVLGVHVD